MNKLFANIRAYFKPKHVKILVDSLETFAKLNYARDLATGIFNEPVTWKKVKEEYIAEAKLTVKDYVLTEEEIDRIIRSID